ncbi:hypothetical protein [Arsenicibacter rosenii]|uniref:Uncharacterized protein n=1 Tax=Arsenicibacter rosenii TaxID=1750698 RepID=A0A1S2VA09_9BACT|nr:hypothetical protein [Arsenicibacter rosenii]OIN55499.1 hypothetical protein BLX24_29995 [Arsenicibacter rosenii]
MQKRITLSVPVYLQKFLVGEFIGEYSEKGACLHVEKRSEIGKLIHLVSRYYPFPVAVPKPAGTTITISYYCREKSYEFPADKYGELTRQLDEIFRRSMICEVRRVHELAGGDYGVHIRQFLNRYQIEADVDVDFETIRKIYRDYLHRISQKNRKILA